MFHGLLTAEQHQQAMEIQANLTDEAILEYMECESDYDGLKRSFIATARWKLLSKLTKRPDCEWCDIVVAFRVEFIAYMAAHYRAELAASGQILPEIVEEVAGVLA